MNPRFNAPLAAKMAAETELFQVPEIAKRHGVTRQTVRNHLAREQADTEFQALCRKERDLLRAEADRRRHEWAEVSVSALRNLLEALETAARKSTEEFNGGKLEKGRIRELAGAVKIVGELNVSHRVLLGRPSADRKDSSAPEAEDGVRDTGSGKVH